MPACLGPTLNVMLSSVISKLLLSYAAVECDALSSLLKYSHSDVRRLKYSLFLLGCQ